MKIKSPHQYYSFLLVIIFLFNCSNNDDTSTKPIILKNTSFVKTIGGSLNESAQSVTETIDGGYAILGYTQSNDGDIDNKTNQSFDFWLLKFDKDDTLQWQKTYGGTGDDRGQDIIQTQDGGYAVLGYSKSADGDLSENAGANDFWICKLNTSGNISWQKSYGFLGADIGYALTKTNDNGYLITGVLDVSASNGQGNSKSNGTLHAGGDYWVIKLNANGQKEWSKFFGGTFTDTPYDVIQTPNNNYIIVGSSDSDDVDIKNNKGAYDFWIVNISENGNLLWEKSFGGSEIDEAWGIILSNNGNLVIAGDTRSNNQDISENNGAADIFVIKITPNGDLIWNKSFGGTNFDAAQSISKTSDGGFVISGNSRSSNIDLTNNNGQNDALVIKLNSAGNLEWQKTIGGSNIDLAFDATELNDGSIIIVGESSSSDIDISANKGFSDLLIFKIKE
ncbi:hypothetical protein [Hyunsoonleella pacifica]|uniref:Bulb-type lectin domain-containing protein n=1 Tax=Hyunsoonleella pacifica TaxID=1080224 RepID=A0A4Q9FRC9_9FLAO|nr:hypothetical protein [Hyunsoonleella pacifica]TBN15806.1 hypothetical protein EYD46_11850 [Hyunsoonleella pacifica]GGD22820.1 lipoprotein [Hyunsoonleella pacifica]